MTVTLSLGDGASVRSLVASDAAAVLELIEQNRAHLDKWLRWSARVRTLDDVAEMIARFGRGLATRATASAVEHLLREVRLHRVEMICGVANTRSRAVAERLGFTNEGVRRESYWITDRFADHVVYGLLDRELRREPAGAEP